MKTKSFLIHNPSCSKSRGAKEILEEEGVKFEVIEYLKTALSEELLLSLPRLLELDYPQMIRTGEKIYSELNLGSKKLQPQDWVATIKEHPILLERPIFIHHGKAIIARPPEKVFELLV